jgi:hypothetical protein
MTFATLEDMSPYYLALLSFNIEVKMGGKEVQDAIVTAKLHKSHACRHIVCAQVPFMVHPINMLYDNGAMILVINWPVSGSS